MSALSAAGSDTFVASDTVNAAISTHHVTLEPATAVDTDADAAPQPGAGPKHRRAPQVTASDISKVVAAPMAAAAPDSEVKPHAASGDRPGHRTRGTYHSQHTFTDIATLQAGKTNEVYAHVKLACAEAIAKIDHYAIAQIAFQQLSHDKRVAPEDLQRTVAMLGTEWLTEAHRELDVGRTRTLFDAVVRQEAEAKRQAAGCCTML